MENDLKQDANSVAPHKKPFCSFVIEHWHKIAFFLMIYDFVAVNISFGIALWLRFDCRFSDIPEIYLNAWVSFIPIYSILCITVFWFCRLYHSLWRFASYREFVRVFMATLITCVAHILIITVFFRRMPISYYCIGSIMQFLFILFVRFSYRFINLERSRVERERKKAIASRVMLIGAGSAGRMILRDANNTEEYNAKVCCIIDDNSNKWGRYIDNIPIVGGRNDIIENVKKYKVEKIFLAIPSLSPASRKDILDICKETGCELMNLPGMYQFVNGEVNVEAMKEVNVEDLLGREPIEVNMDEIFGFLDGKTILVTGGGGSIGSELCRQIAKNRPKCLIVFDIYENNAHAIQLELNDSYPDLNLKVLIGSVRDSRRLNEIFEKYKPDIVYHAAAHKHVPLMEYSPCEAIKNNVIGTYKTAYAAMMNGCSRFVLISTDKAVNPTNIMGASKRICEMVVQSFDRKIKENKANEIFPITIHSEEAEVESSETNKLPEKIKTEFVAVRFGNVLGSNGSVIPRFREQILKGGPVTVTHPEIIRYFMTIPEAVSLVLQAGTYAKGGEIFVLDMGSPVKIDTLARNLIKLSGYKPDEDIKIVYTGLRPGEKLYEEKLMSEEGLKKTENNLIHIGNPIPFEADSFLESLSEMLKVAYDGDEEKIRELAARVVPTYVIEKKKETKANI